MKKLFLQYSLKIIKDYYPSYDDIQMEKIRYGLEATYLTITKTFVILTICFILGIFKECILLLVTFNLLRVTGFGLHATKSWMCWVSSIIIFIGIPYLCKVMILPTAALAILAALSIICFLFYAPADTKKRPLVRKKRRIIYKTITVSIGILYTIGIFITDITLIQNSLVSAMLIESLLIHPLTYKIFHLSYNNYKTYVFAN
ncbi:MAG: accessory gene regulator B family protein [bacterium]|nr:accessory gene regulator B family protein [bacterium]